MINLFQDIKNSKDWNIINLINKGWSDDVKYHIKTNDGRQLLLRISDISAFNRKKQEFEVMNIFNGCSIVMSRPLDFGICNENKNVFTLLTWIDGIDAEVIIPTLTVKEQYWIGYSAGKTLRNLHEIPASDNQEDWSERFNKKINRKIKNYKECPIRIEKADKIIDYINDNRYLLENRAQTFQHGDFHIGNMILTQSNEIGIIDFNRYDYGDPWEEFNRIVWCAETSQYFASGRINGYFQGEVPEEFFKLMALYIGNNTLSSVPWAIPFGKAEVNTMINQAENVIDWYDNFTSYIPSWYIPHNKMDITDS